MSVSLKRGPGAVPVASGFRVSEVGVIRAKLLKLKAFF